MGKIGRGMELAKLSWAVLMKEKGLMIFPIISGILTMIVAASFFVPLALWGVFEDANSLNWWLLIIPIFLFYLVTYFIIIFFNSALVACVMYSFDGGKPTLPYGIAEARKHMRQVLAWAAVSATVGLVLKMISQEGGIFGQIAAMLAGVAWTIASYFVIPIIVMEGLGPKAALKRSAGLFKTTWGEAAISNIGIGLIFFALCLLGFIPMFLAFYSGSFIIMIGLLAFTLIYWIILGIISSALTTIVMSALYRFATTGKTSANFNVDLLKEPFPQKNNSNWGKI
ncbi:MAG: DUF6159 family protein [Methanomassiliicoccales archaeon]